MLRKSLLVLGFALLLVAAVMFVWGSDSPAPVSAQDGGECDGPCPDWIVDAWSGSAHADTEAEAFNHWNEDTPAEVPTTCAKCHSEGGYLDFLGADGSAAGVVDTAAPIGTVITCTACHNPVAIAKDSVVFPSGVELTGLGESARCMECHQGRASTVSVNDAIEKSGLGLDEPSPDLGFINIHYFAAAASLFGSEVHGGYEFEGQSYQPKNLHVPAYDTCASCHSPHTLEVKVTECAACHTGVATTDDLKAIRMPGSLVDYDGDGDITEGIYSELKGMQELLLQAIQVYGSEVAGMPILYNAEAYPYFFGDADGNGEVNGDEGGYKLFTPRLLQAAYNYQAYEKDPGAFAHNPKYYAQLLYDSIATLNEAISSPVDLSQAHRNPAGHFDATAEAFRHWDEEGEVPATCTKCHTAEGLPFMIKNDVTIAFPPSNSLACSTCHANFQDFSLYEVTDATFPSGAVLGFEDNLPANLCINCHQGRESTVSVNKAIEAAGVGNDEVSPDLRFRNVHYFAAGATLFGSEAQGAYQYEGKEYVGRNMHVPTANTCTACHDVHQLTVNEDLCATCHAGIEGVENIRMAAPDYDGDGADEGVAGEIMTMHDDLLVAIQSYATDTVGTAIAYNAAAYPYWFTDANGNGVVDADETDGYATWTPTLLRAAYNYQYVAKDPGAFTHNGKYIAEILYDSLEAIGGPDAVTGMTRP